MLLSIMVSENSPSIVGFLNSTEVFFSYNIAPGDHACTIFQIIKVYKTGLPCFTYISGFLLWSQRNPQVQAPSIEYQSDDVTKNFFFAFQHFEYNTIHRQSMMNNLHSPNLVEIGPWGPEIQLHEYLISLIEIRVNWPGSYLHCIQWG